MCGVRAAAPAAPEAGGLFAFEFLQGGLEPDATYLVPSLSDTEHFRPKTTTCRDHGPNLLVNAQGANTRRGKCPFKWLESTQSERRK
jgi:hypothetical protein